MAQSGLALEAGPFTFGLTWPKFSEANVRCRVQTLGLRRH
ncbi:hypothetical protein PanWU01x14_232490 [Parasponia andersonii]|uniref:Uncharacterized protein n=1 Tax=Parasponia andersonii TaxID=3476 RepID=A0A2P5BJW9_PARAD|nr:hypothetical protein PanWU01x14_232490 [Parasponia andersonii]